MCNAQGREANQQQNVENTRSSGFHVLEIHAPTAGMSALGLAFLLTIAVVLWTCYKRVLKKRASTRRELALPGGERVPREALERSLAERLDNLEKLGSRLMEREQRRRRGLREMDDMHRDRSRFSEIRDVPPSRLEAIDEQARSRELVPLAHMEARVAQAVARAQIDAAARRRARRAEREHRRRETETPAMQASAISAGAAALSSAQASATTARSASIEVQSDESEWDDPPKKRADPVFKPVFEF